MTLTKKTMVREIGRRTRLKNRDVQIMLETLFEVWTEELVEGSGLIELESLFVIETHQVVRGLKPMVFKKHPAPRLVRRITLRASRRLRVRLRVSSRPDT